jgi:hypothetical protein
VPEGGLALSSRERHRILTVPEELQPSRSLNVDQLISVA